MDRRFAAIGALLGALGVAAGAFGAHVLEGRLAPSMLEVFQTAVRYHLIHALALFAAAWSATRWPSRWSTAAGWCFVAGVVLFSGSLYALSLTGLDWIGAITPFGGLAFIAGWLCLGWAAFRGAH